MRYVVNTPNGNIGRLVAKHLLAAGHEVVGIHRSPDRVSDLVTLGMVVVEGSTDDASVVKRAFEGADALVWVTPVAFRPDFVKWAKEAAAMCASAAVEAGISRVINLSSGGAQNQGVNGPVGMLYEVEAVWNASSVNVMHVRPGFFFENFLEDLSTIAGMNRIFKPVPDDRAFPMIATADIATAIVDVMLNDTWKTGEVRGLHGPEDLTFAQAAAILSQGLGRDIEYIRVTDAVARSGMAQAGLPDFLIESLIELYQGLTSGTMTPAEARTPATTTPTAFREFVDQSVAPALAEMQGAR